LHGVQEVGGSNPLVPTIEQKTTLKVVFCFKYCGYETNFAGSTISNVRIVRIGI